MRTTGLSQARGEKCTKKSRLQRVDDTLGPQLKQLKEQSRERHSSAHTGQRHSGPNRAQAERDSCGADHGVAVAAGCLRATIRAGVGCATATAAASSRAGSSGASRTSCTSAVAAVVTAASSGGSRCAAASRARLSGGSGAGGTTIDRRRVGASAALGATGRASAPIRPIAVDVSDVAHIVAIGLQRAIDDDRSEMRLGADRA